jgi:hypothetical protein
MPRHSASVQNEIDWCIGIMTSLRDDIKMFMWGKTGGIVYNYESGSQVQPLSSSQS